MKYSIDINRMDIYEITQSTIPYLKEYRPSPCKGKDRKPKYLIPHKMKEFLRIESYPRDRAGAATRCVPN